MVGNGVLECLLMSDLQKYMQIDSHLFEEWFQAFWYDSIRLFWFIFVPAKREVYPKYFASH